MEELEHTVRLFALGEEAQEVLRKACEDQMVNQEEFRKAVNNLAVLCAYSAEQIVNSVSALRNTLSECFTPSIQAWSEQFQSLFNTEELFFMVPPYIKHIAYNHPKARVRNKNWNRMWKIRERYMKCHKN